MKCIQSGSETGATASSSFPRQNACHFFDGISVVRAATAMMNARAATRHALTEIVCFYVRRELPTLYSCASIGIHFKSAPRMKENEMRNTAHTHSRPNDSGHASARATCIETYGGRVTRGVTRRCIDSDGL